MYPRECGSACGCVPANEADRHLRRIPLPGPTPTTANAAATNPTTTTTTTKRAAWQAIDQLITGYTESM